MYIELRNLPASILRALQSLEYHNKDIRVETAEKVSLGSPSGDGSRAFACVGNIITGGFRTIYGSWGGSNMFTKTIVDDCEKEFPIPIEGFVILGCTGGYKHSPFCTVYVNPKSVNSALLPPVYDLSSQYRKILACYKQLKSGPYRQAALNEHGANQDILVHLVSLGYLANKGNGISITTKGKNAVEGVRI